MSKHTSLIAAALLSCATAGAEVLEVGKSWVCAEYYVGNDNTARPIYYKVDIVKDTLVENSPCKIAEKYYFGNEPAIQRFIISETTEGIRLHEFDETSKSWNESDAVNGSANSRLDNVGFVEFTLPDQTDVKYNYVEECSDNGNPIFNLSESAFNSISAPERPRMLTRGKSWLMGQAVNVRTATGYEQRTEYLTVEVGQDTIVDSKQCSTIVAKNLQSNSAAKYVVREAYSTLSLLVEDETTFGTGVQKGDFLNIMTFNLKDANVICRTAAEDMSTENLYINAAPTARGAQQFAVRVNPDQSEPVSCWVEGIGMSWNSPYSSWLTFFPLETGRDETSEGLYMIECRENDKIIFEAKDFAFPYADAAITAVEKGAATSARTYDLHGRPVRTPRPGNVYIRGNKKTICCF